jgi:hypothetical protein
MVEMQVVPTRLFRWLLDVAWLFQLIDCLFKRLADEVASDFPGRSACQAQNTFMIGPPLAASIDLTSAGTWNVPNPSSFPQGRQAIEDDRCSVHWISPRTLPERY